MATEIPSEEYLVEWHAWMANKHFWCSHCEKIQSLRLSQDPTTCVQYCCSCLKWVGSVLLKEENTHFTVF